LIARVIQVAVPRPLHAVYDYQVPEKMPVPAIGCRVQVPFGRSSTIGICVATHVTHPHSKLKEITKTLDTQPLVPDELMSLAHWMTTYYHYPLGEVLATLLPAAARKGAACDIEPADYWHTATAKFANTRAKRQQALFEYLKDHGPCSGESIIAAGFTRQLLRSLVSSGAAERCTPAEPTQFETPPEPTPGQQKAITTINASRNRFQPFLLEGVTGSGKTEVYLRTIAPVIDAGAQVLVLVPEIALTPQTLGRFQKRFAKVGMVHSNLTDHERLQTWLKCAKGELSVLIGTRSAVFTPFARLGLVVVDEEHDSSYKQQEGLRYSARDLAIKRAQGNNVPIVLGSATPSLESVYNVNRGRYQQLALPTRAGGAEMPVYHIIDMRGQQHTDGISIPLERVIRSHLAADGQVLVFLNRRGYAPTLLCAACGWQAHCSDCDARLTLHRTPRELVCHHCSLKFQVPRHCEACGLESLLPVGLGTQRTEQGLAQLFPDVPIYRIDRDTTRSNRRLEAQFAKVNEGNKCIMVGTQMLAKGHHFPNVTLVAVLNADAGFLSPDFRAPERTAALIVQVAGRAGRAERPGEVWIQSFQPENPTLKRLIEDGYAGFAQAELAERIKVGLPPAKPMALLRAEAPNGQDALDLLERIKQQLQGIEVFGPVPAPLARVANRWRYQLMLLASTRAALHRTLATLQIPKTPHTLRWSIDVDPYDSL
jgi:primosomal protein N' (replication factor Y) (superfamily II helicase)